MSEAEKDAPEKSVQDFLQRWSRRKLGIADAEDAAAPAPAEPQQAGEPQPDRPPPAAAAAESPAAFDLASLPPIESIDATTDIRAFLAPGVPVELSRAALRRAWTSDPAIRDFVGIAENQWDFTNPDSVPGFGSLEFTEELRAMVSRLFGDVPQTAVNSDPAAAERVSECGRQRESLAAQQTQRDLPTSPDPFVEAEGQGIAALQTGSAPEGPEPPQRKHGTALPK